MLLFGVVQHATMEWKTGGEYSWDRSNMGWVDHSASGHKLSDELQKLNSLFALLQSSSWLSTRK
jgi:hypothetical protein